MRRPGADLEEKREPRVTGKPTRSTRRSGRALTSAAIEKRALSPGGGNRSSCPISVIPIRSLLRNTLSPNAVPDGRFCDWN